MANTLLASLVVGALGVLVAPLTSIESQALPLQVVPALAAALFANFTSIGIACAAGLGIGALQNIVYYVSTQSWFPTDHGVALPGVQALLVFLLIVVALFVRGTRLPQRGELVEQGLPAVPRPDRLLRPALIGTVATAAALVVFPFDFRQALVNTIIAVVLILSLVVMTGFVGQISIVQLALSGVSGFVISHVARDLGIGFPLGAVIGIGVATVLGIAIAASALRVRGVQLAVVTLAATVAIEEFWFANTTWGAGATGTGVPEPKIFGLDLGTDASFRGVDGKLPSPILGLVVLGVGVLLCMLVANLRRTNLGQRMLAVRSNERAAAAIGINVRNVKLAAFGLSSFIAGVAGAMYAYNFGSVSASRFTVLTAFGVIAFAYVGGITMVTGAMIAALLSTEALFPHALDAWFGVSGTWFLLFGACGLIFNLVLYPDGIAGGMYRKRQLRKRAQENGIRRKSLVQAVTRGRMSPTRTGEP
jgi:branched-chain amino acid transport system permease protein